jgi:hypothetical protein
MDLIIDLDGIKDSSKQDWLLGTLKLMGIGYHTAEKPQTVDDIIMISNWGTPKSKRAISLSMTN